MVHNDLHIGGFDKYNFAIGSQYFQPTQEPLLLKYRGGHTTHLMAAQLSFESCAAIG